MKLNDIPKHNIYQVPDDYFDRLPRRVMERTAAKETSAVPVFGNLWRPVRLALVPLVLILVFAGVYFSQLQLQQNDTQPAYVSVASISNDEIVAYLDNYAALEASDFEELSLSEQELTSDFLNISSDAADEELDYYNLNTLTYQ